MSHRLHESLTKYRSMIKLKVANLTVRISFLTGAFGTCLWKYATKTRTRKEHTCFVLNLSATDKLGELWSVEYELMEEGRGRITEERGIERV